MLISGKVMAMVAMVTVISGRAPKASKVRMEEVVFVEWEEANGGGADGDASTEEMIVMVVEEEVELVEEGVVDGGKGGKGVIVDEKSN